MAIGIIFQIGNNLGIQKAVTVQAAKETELKSEGAVEIDLPVAIVNLDEGIVRNDKKINYGSNLIETVSENIKVTGLEDARQGIEAGEYSAYIIIPNTFSEKVMTINQQPIKSTITYAIAADIELTEREKVLESIVNIYNTFSNSLSKVYTSSLLKEYHDVQDAADKIMQRDTLDMEKLLAVNGYDLMEIIEIPEMETVEKNISALDLSENYGANSTGLSNINSAYKTYVQDGQNGLDDLLSQTGTIKEKEETTEKGIRDVTDKIENIAVNEVDDTTRARNEDEKYQKSKDYIVNDTSGTGVLNVYNDNIKVFNQSVVEQNAKHEAAADSYNNFVAELDSNIGAETEVDTTISYTIDGAAYTIPAFQKTYVINKTEEVTTEIATYRQEIIDAYVQKLIDVVTVADGEFGYALAENNTAMGTNVSMTEVLLGENLTTYEDYENYAESLISAADANMDIEEIRINAVVPQEKINVPQITIDGTDYTEMPEIDTHLVGDEIDKLISAAQEGRTARNNEYSSLVTDYKDNVSVLKTQVNDVTAAYSDESALQMQLNSGLSIFSLGSYIQDDEVGKYAEELQRNNEDISEKVNANNEKYETYTTNVYEATSNNVTSLQKNISDGQEASNKKLEDGLAVAKNSRESSNEENVLTLKSFSTRLAYSRLGELENKEVYDFIAEPLLLENRSQSVKSIPQAAADMGLTAPIKEIFKNESNIPQWMLIVLIAVIVFGFGLFGVARRMVHRKKEDF